MTGPSTPSLRGSITARLRSAGCVFAEDEAQLLLDAARESDTAAARLEDLVQRRVDGEPLEQLLGHVAFAGLALSVGPGAFVPRQRTRLLARLARDEARHRHDATVVELCSGVAPVASLIARDVPSVRLHVADIDPRALTHAARNVPVATVHTGDLFDALPPSLHGRIDVLAANAPYVPTRQIATMPPEARDHEPHQSLDGGADGVDVHRAIAAACSRWLAPGAALLVETSEAQADLTRAAFEDVAVATEIVCDESLDATVVVARTG